MENGIAKRLSIVCRDVLAEVRARILVSRESPGKKGLKRDLDIILTNSVLGFPYGARTLRKWSESIGEQEHRDKADVASGQAAKRLARRELRKKK